MGIGEQKSVLIVEDDGIIALHLFNMLRNLGYGVLGPVAAGEAAIALNWRLEVLDQAESLTDLNVPGFNFRGLQGVPKRYSIHINGTWYITFEWEKGEALRVDLEQYH